MDVEELKVQRRLLQQQLGLVDRRVENAAVLLNRKRAAKPLPAGVETFAEHKKSEQQMVSKGVGNVPDMISAPSPVALGGRIEQIRNRALVHRADQTERRRVRDSKVILPAPSKAGAYRKQTVQPTMFPTRYSRGELPCAIEHRASGGVLVTGRSAAPSLRLSASSRVQATRCHGCVRCTTSTTSTTCPSFSMGFAARKIRTNSWRARCEKSGGEAALLLFTRRSHPMPRERTNCSRHRAATPSASCLAFRA